ncbi:MAG: prolipoprotein diacylglyceryl transferase, partial [candidate division NC10 bacterium]|nr:prolipoprotein diacylglyceryl transferase [candidate division NC10 bacterium]
LADGRFGFSAMHPILFKIGPFTLHTYGLFISMGVLLAIALAAREARREGLDPQKMLDLGFYLLVASIIGSRLLFVLIFYPDYLHRPWAIFKLWEGGLVFYGGFVLALAVGIWYLRRNRLPLWRTADLWAAPLALGHALGRIGCFSAGCCYGKPSSVPWAVTFSDPQSLAILGVPLHPVQLYETLSNFLLFCFLFLFRRFRRFEGQVFWLYVLLYSLLRFLLEFYRGDARGFLLPPYLSISQGISIPLAVASLIMLSHLSKRRA